MSDFVRVTYGQTGKTQVPNPMGMRPMQARVYDARAAQFILLKAPPAAGKSRALMFVALDKLENQGVGKVIVCVPETSIGASFRSTDLTSHGFFADWQVDPRWNLCLSGAEEGATSGKVRAVRDFMASGDRVLVCTHATFRFAFDEIAEDEGTAAFDDCLIAIDEFHHVSAGDDNRLGEILRRILNRGQAHVMAMTGSYFRGDSIPVLRPEDEARFRSITYSYYEQLDGYRFLKSLGISYSFYRDQYISAIPEVLNPELKTIIHIPHRGSAEAYDAKQSEVGAILSCIGEVIGREEATGFDLVQLPDGRVLKVADLVDDGPERDLVKASLTREIVGPDGKRDDDADRAKVDLIIALGMAKEGFDWVWCEHALTIGYRSSLTEIIQIIGRATRDAPGKRHAQFTNLVAEPGVETGVVTDAVNDMLKAISGALLMEQVLQPNFRFYRREDGDTRPPVEVDGEGRVHIGIGGLMAPPTDRARAIVENDMHELVAQACQQMDRRTVADDVAPEVATQLVLTNIIERTYEDLTPDETEAIRQDLAARMNIAAIARRMAQEEMESGEQQPVEDSDADDERSPDALNLIRMVKKFINVRELDIDLIDSINPFREGFDIASKALDTPLLQQIQSAMVAQRVQMTEEEALVLWPRIKRFTAQEGRPPNPNSPDDLERRLAEAHAYIRTKKAERMRAAQGGA
ncbi:DEAD/DEAH box helicase [Paracoccus sp. P2]|uniref:DEAD/DEAH box helicase n=1 Tax=Paracoccus sp. P2 TaxID=3248840 RepID=UPI00391F6B6C